MTKPIDALVEALEHCVVGLDKCRDWPGAHEECSKAMHSATAALAQARAEQAEPVAVAFLDIGAGGYVDLGSDLTDGQLAELPLGRHALAIVGTFGVDGYAPTTPPAAPVASAEQAEPKPVAFGDRLGSHLQQVYCIPSTGVPPWMEKMTPLYTKPPAPVQAVEPLTAWQPQFEAISHKQETLVREFCAEIAGPFGGVGNPPDPVRLLEMAQALYEAERDDLAAAPPLPKG